MSKNSQQKGVSLLVMLLLVAVSSTIVLSSNNTVGLAHAQSTNQTSSITTATPPPFPSSLSSQTMQNTFHAKGVIGTLVLDPNAISDVPPLQNSLELSLVGIGALMLLIEAFKT
jgi:hypothetical protein